MTGKSTKKKNRRRLVVLGCMAVTALPATCACADARPYPALYQDGDLILRRGEGLFSDIARNFSATDKRFSHAGIIVTYRQRAHVVHSVHEQARGFDGVVIESLGDFLHEATDWAVYRFRLEKQQQQLFARTALDYVQRHIPFDSRFDLDSRGALYCTEFIWRVSAEIARPNPIQPASTRPGARYISIEDLYRHNNAMLIETMH